MECPCRFSCGWKAVASMPGDRRAPWLKRCVQDACLCPLPPLLSLPGRVAPACLLFQPSGGAGTGGSPLLVIISQLKLLLGGAWKNPSSPVPLGASLLQDCPLGCLPHNLSGTQAFFFNPTCSLALLPACFHLILLSYTGALPRIVLMSPLSTIPQSHVLSKQVVSSPTSHHVAPSVAPLFLSGPWPCVLP